MVNIPWHQLLELLSLNQLRNLDHICLILHLSIHKLCGLWTYVVGIFFFTLSVILWTCAYLWYGLYPVLPRTCIIYNYLHHSLYPILLWTYLYYQLFILYLIIESWFIALVEFYQLLLFWYWVGIWFIWVTTKYQFLKWKIPYNLECAYLLWTENTTSNTRYWTSR